jgi:hypothetical protein
MENKEDILIDFTLYNFNQGYCYFVSLDKIDDNYKENCETYFKNNLIEISFAKKSLKKEILENLNTIKTDIKEVFLRASFSRIISAPDYTYAFLPLSVYNISLSEIIETNEDITFIYKK